MNKKYILAASYDLKVHVSDAESGNHIDEFEIPGSQVNRLISISGFRFIAGAYQSIYLYDTKIQGRKQPQTFVGHESNVTDLCFQGGFLFSSSEDCSIKRWDIRTMKAETNISANAPLNGLVVSPDCKYAYACSENGCIYSYDLINQSKISSFDMSSSPIRSISATSDASFFIASSQDGKSSMFKTENGKFSQVYTIKSHNDTQLRCIISPNNRYFATSASENSARIWKLDNGELKQNLISNAAREWIWDISFSSDSTQVCSAGSDCSCRIWDVECGRMIKNLPPLSKCVTAVAFMES